LSRDKPLQKAQRVLGIRLPTSGHEVIVNALTRDAQNPGQPGLVSETGGAGFHGAGKFVP